MKFIKLLIIVSVIAVLLVVGGVVAFISFADPNDFKDTIAEKVKDATGRDLTLEGDLEWAFWPKIKIKAGPLALSNAPGFGDEPFLAANELQIAVATLPLLKNQIEMDTVKLYGARINLAANADGVTNWADLAGDGGEHEKGGGQIATIALGGVDIQDAKLTWKNAADGQNVTVDQLKVSTGALTFGDPIAFDLSFTALANQPALDSDVALKGTVAYDLSEETYHIEPLDLDVAMRGKHLPGGKANIKAGAVVDVDLVAGIAQVAQLALSGLGTNLQGDIVATDIESESPGAVGNITLSGDDLAMVFKAFDLPVAKQIAGLKQRNFNLATEFDANMKTGVVSLPKLEGAMLGAKLNATLEAERANTDTPAAKGELAASGPDLPALLAVFGQLQGMEAKTLEGLVSSLRKTKDRSFNLQLNFDTDRKTGHINLPKLDAKLLGNTISGNVASSGSGDKPTVTGDIKASGPDLPSLLAVAATFQGPDSGLHPIAKSLSSSRNKAFSLQSNFSSDGKTGTVALPKLAAKGLGMTIDGQLKGQNLDSDNGTIDGNLSIAGGKDIAGLLTALGQKDLAKSVKALNVEAGIKGTMSDLTMSPLKIVSKVQGAGQKAPLDLTLSTGSTRANLDKETLSVKDLSLRGLGMNVTGNLDATNIKSDAAYKGNLNVPPFNLRNVLKSLNQKIPPMANAKALSRFGMNTEINGTKSSLALAKLNMILDQTIMKGDITIANFEGPDVAFGLGVDKINADHYLPPKAQGKPVTPETAAAGAAQLPLETLRSLKVKGDLLIGSLQISGAKMQNVKLSVNARGGILNLNPVAASLYNGTYNGGVSLDATKKTPTVGFNTNLKGVNIEPLLFDMTGDRSISGVANLNANLRAAGARTDLMTHTLNGPLKFQVLNGVYRGIDVANMLAQLEVMIESKRPANLQKGGETRFQSLSGTVNFANGVGSNNDLLLDGSGFKITGRGVVADLRNNTMKYDAKVAVDSGSATRGESNYNLGGYTVPIRCRGPLGADACKPDAGDIIGEIAKNSIKKEVGKQLEKAIGGDAGKALKDLFKF